MASRHFPLIYQHFSWLNSQIPLYSSYNLSLTCLDTLIVLPVTISATKHEFENDKGSMAISEFVAYSMSITFISHTETIYCY